MGAGVLSALAYIPVKWRDPFLASIGRFVGRKAKSARRRADINLRYCFPKWDKTQRETVLDSMFETAPQSFVMLAELCLRGPERILKRTSWQGLEIIERFKEQGRNVIFMVPHGWAVDIPAMLLAAQGQQMAAMFHHQKILLLIIYGIKHVTTLMDDCIHEKPVLSHLFLLFDKDSGDIIYLTKIMVQSIANLSIFLVLIKQHCPRLGV